MTAPAVAMTQAVAGSLLHSVSCANTAAATTAGIDLQGYEGAVKVIADVGAVTGTLTMKVQDSADNSTFADVAAGIVSLTDNGAAGTYAVPTTAVASHLYEFTFDSRSVKRYVLFLGTISTGPSVLSILVIGVKKYRP